MTLNQKYFLAVAEELNISKAARKLYITPQCLSNHVKRMEKTLGAILFQRKPHLALTPEGEAMVRALHQIQIVENSLVSEIQEIKSGVNGILRIGAATTRARYLIPMIFRQFNSEYPAVKISIFPGITEETERMVDTGALDMLIGLDRPMSSNIEKICLDEEKVVLIISDNLLAQYFKDDFPECKKQFQCGVRLADFVGIPFLLNHETSSQSIALQQFLQVKGLKLNVVLQANDNNLHFAMCAMDYGAFICPETILTMREILSSETKKPLNAFPITDFDPHNRIVLAYHKNTYMPKYARKFIEITQKMFLEIKSENNFIF